jgi:hypothetical protein
MVRIAAGFMRNGRNSYYRTDVRVTDERYLEPVTPDVSGIPPLKVADRYAQGRRRT